MLSKVLVYLTPKPEEYDVVLYIYSEEGKLLESKEYRGVKQIVIKSSEVRISRQIFHEQIALFVEASRPEIELRSGSLLYIIDKG